MLNIQYRYKKELNFNSGTHTDTDSAPVNTPSLIISINNQLFNMSINI